MVESLASRSSSAPAWTGERVHLEIAGIRYDLRSVDPDLTLAIEGAAERFVVEPGSVDITVEARWGDFEGEMAAAEKVFESGSLWRRYRDGDTHFFQFASEYFGNRPYKTARVSDDFQRCEVTMQRAYFDTDVPLYPLEYPLDELLLISMLSEGKGVEIHGCGLVDSRGDGILFAGQSGAGKTTMAGLWADEPGITILSDDRIALRPDGERILMYGTPWHGDAGFALPGPAPLKCVYVLRHGSENRAEPLPAAEAVGQLFARCFPPFHDPAALDRTLGVLEKVVRTVRCEELHVVPDEAIVRFVLESCDEGHAR